MTKLGNSVKSGISAILKAVAPASAPPAFTTDASHPSAKTGNPPSKCYGAEPSCHSDSW